MSHTIFSDVSFSNIGLRVILCATVLAFSTSCGDGEEEPPAEPENLWYNLDHGVKAHLKSQSCSDKKPLISYLVVDFKDVKLAEGINANDINQAEKTSFEITCDKNNCGTPREIVGDFDLHYDGSPYITFGPIRAKNKSFEVEVNVIFAKSDGKKLPLTASPIKVNLPHTVCGDAGDVSCGKTSPCKEVPISHICKVDYEQSCDVSISCSNGYAQVDNDHAGTGELRVFGEGDKKTTCIKSS